jgi:hypothetical protein
MTNCDHPVPDPTVTIAVPVSPLFVAESWLTPVSIEPAVNTPEVETVAKVGHARVHITSLTGDGGPELKVPTAVNCCDCPSSTVEVAGWTPIDTKVGGGGGDPLPPQPGRRTISPMARLSSKYRTPTFLRVLQ